MILLRWLTIIIILKIWVASGYAHRLHSMHRNERQTEDEVQTDASLGDKNILEDIINMLNSGKQTLGLKTDNPQHLIKLVEQSGSPYASTPDVNVQQVMAESSNVKQGQDAQHVAISGDENEVKIANVTDVEKLVPKNTSDVEDVFKMIMERKMPKEDGKAESVQRITIIERDQMKPVSPKVRRRCVRKLLGITSGKRLSRHKRTRKRRRLEQTTELPPEENDADFTIEKHPQDYVVEQRSTELLPPEENDADYTIAKHPQDYAMELTDTEQPSKENDVDFTISTQPEEYVIRKRPVETYLDKLQLIKDGIRHRQIRELPPNIKARDQFVDSLRTILFISSMCLLTFMLVLAAYRCSQSPRKTTYIPLRQTSDNSRKIQEQSFGEETFERFLMDDGASDQLEWQSENGEWLPMEDDLSPKRRTEV